MGGGGGGGSVNGRIFWSSTSPHLATSNEASKSGCHGYAKSDLKVFTKSCSHSVCVSVVCEHQVVVTNRALKCDSVFTFKIQFSFI